MRASIVRMAAQAGKSNRAGAQHPIHVHPARPLYRFMATALGASMWFFVCIYTLRGMPFIDCALVVLSGETGWVFDGIHKHVGMVLTFWQTCLARLETSMGPLIAMLATIYTTTSQYLRIHLSTSEDPAEEWKKEPQFLLVYTSVTTIDTNMTLQALS